MTKDSAIGWLRTIAVNRLVDAFRPRARHEKVPAIALVETTAPAAEDEVTANRVDQNLEQVLLRLPLELRQVLRAMVLDDLSVRDPRAAGPDRAAGDALMTHPTTLKLAPCADSTTPHSGPSRSLSTRARTAVRNSPQTPSRALSS
ncbi:RNA polymerase sigma factor [Streptomyces viridosporus]|uniref:RNA polymerase sigma factor n=1 Tax=Streptomyces viridosporus TaxID=67581 RepID=UPI003702FD50